MHLPSNTTKRINVRHLKIKKIYRKKKAAAYIVEHDANEYIEGYAKEVHNSASGLLRNVL